jgi:hypothetical protein
LSFYFSVRLLAIAIDMVSHIWPRFEDVRRVELDFLYEHWGELNPEEMTKILGRITTGSLPHSKEILANLVLHSRN